jgi:hypothetical protein
LIASPLFIQHLLRMKKLLSVILLLLFSACATNRNPDWNARVGHYTYDDAITELGIPERSATLSDGSTVCEWLRYQGSYYATGPYYRGSRFYNLNRFPDRYLRLVFGPDHQLLRAEKFMR